MWKRDKRVSPEERTKWPDLQILTETSKTLDCLTWSFESAITGAAVDGRMTACFEKRTVNCRCGETNPTRRHLLWRCQAYSSARQRFGLAQFPELATAEEGLLVKSVDKPVFLNQICQVTLSELVTGGELDRIRNLVHDMANNSKTKSGPIVIGTDGSTHRHMYITKAPLPLRLRNQLLHSLSKAGTKLRRVLKRGLSVFAFYLFVNFCHRAHPLLSCSVITWMWFRN